VTAAGGKKKTPAVVVEHQHWWCVCAPLKLKKWQVLLPI